MTPAGTVTEAFSWLATAVCVGTSAGTAIAGTLAQHSGPAAAFTFAGGAGALAVLITLVGARTIASSLHTQPSWPGAPSVAVTVEAEAHLQY